MTYPLEGRQVHMLGLDVWSADARTAYRRLLALKTTVAVEEPAAYRQCPEFCRMRIDTEMTEAQLSDWLWRCHFDGGVFERKNCLRSEGYLWDSAEAVPLLELSA